MDKRWWTKLSFLSDWFKHLNKLNSSIQSRNKNILTSLDKIIAFIEKLNLWITKIIQGNLIIYPRAALVMHNNILLLIVESIVLLKVKMNKYFPSVNIKNYNWIRCPFDISISNLIDLKTC